MTPKRPINDISVWMRLLLEVGIIVVAIAMAFGGLDKRLAVIEAKVSAASEAQKDWASKTALDELRQRMDRLEQGGYRGH